ncbi:FG-GAP and VCBS repeat-containing protein [Leptospira kmetyi]|uniref:FG-GAP and VCBS repeat-containing protein n=1 Tax=Leptospira kmetyi TaxID=408139 RepID=UPI0010837B50|nr:FG-GAP and VCBS repeat-containing protein [Leptospira kmetyi]TGK16208.1 hypothetical protein EHO62_10670 [Leptospira kmetyi]TGK32238.1 hypothetical protein EHO66_07650 [Leptospira kmetyi]
MNRFLILLCALPFLSHCAIKSMENACDLSGSLFYKSEIVNFIFTGGQASVCGLSSSLPKATILNIKDKGRLNSGFLIGEMDSSVEGVQVALDDGPFLDAQSSGIQWKFQLPAAGVPSTIPSTGVWKEWSLHTISIRTKLRGSFSFPLTIKIQKGLNKDINGDGYPDALIGSQASSRVRAYLSLGKSKALNSAPVTLITGAGGFGYSVKLGDVDGDGYADALVGSATNTFAVYLADSSTGGLFTTAISSFSIGTGGLLNVEMGDMNGDGFSDVLIGATYDLGNVGRLYLYKSNGVVSQGITFSQQISNPGLAGSTQFFGYAVAMGDVNGDGLSDVISGSVGSSQLGATFVFLAQSGGTYAAYSQTIPGTVSNQWYANAATTVDINQDGLADAAIGAYQEAGTGRVYSYLSNGSTLIGAINSPVVGLSGSTTGTTVAAGDLNGDGLSDLFAGGYAYTATYPNQGVVLTFLSDGNPNGFLNSYLNLLTEPVNMGEMGMGLASADINGDGFSDVLIGASNSVGGSNLGTVYLYISDGAGGYITAPQIFNDPDVNGAFGISVDL